MKIRHFATITLISLFIVCCKSTDVPEPELEAEPKVEFEAPAPDEATPKEVIIDNADDDIEQSPKEETKKEIPQEDVQTDFDDVVEDVFDFDEVEDVIDVIDDEYSRSIEELESNEEITKEQFEKDKNEITMLISELDEIMTGFYFDRWKTYISDESLEYYSNPANLKNAQKKLPDKTIQLKGPKDYFRYVFIPSRQSKSIEEIRYISRKYIKAITVQEDGTPIVYYYFVKENDKWLVSLPEL